MEAVRAPCWGRLTQKRRILLSFLCVLRASAVISGAPCPGRSALQTPIPNSQNPIPKTGTHCRTLVPPIVAFWWYPGLIDAYFLPNFCLAGYIVGGALALILQITLSSNNKKKKSCHSNNNNKTPLTGRLWNSERAGRQIAARQCVV